MIDIDKLNDTLLIWGDCFEKMKEIPDNSVNLILCDPPYNLTNYNSLGNLKEF